MKCRSGLFKRPYELLQHAVAGWDLLHTRRPETLSGVKAYVIPVLIPFIHEPLVVAFGGQATPCQTQSVFWCTPTGI